MSSFAVILPRISGGISAASSGLLLYIILRSETCLRDTYHRIIFGMSCADIIGSFFGALTSLPMPAEPPPGVTYNFDATRIGNEKTCELQGFAIFFGAFTSFSYNCALCTYYALKIAMSFNDATLDRIEPFLFHAVPILSGLGVAIVPLIFDLYNPSTLGAYCTSVPVGCDPITEECERGDFNAALAVTYISVVYILMAFFIMFVSFGLILRKVIHLEKVLSELSSLSRSLQQEESGEQGYANAAGEHAAHNSRFTTKSMLMQMLGYALPLILTLIFEQIDTYQVGLEGYQKPGVITNLRLAFFPSMGFFNLLVFVYHKVSIPNLDVVHNNANSRSVGFSQNNYLLYPHPTTFDFEGL